MRVVQSPREAGTEENKSWNRESALGEEREGGRKRERKKGKKREKGRVERPKLVRSSPWKRDENPTHSYARK